MICVNLMTPKMRNTLRIMRYKERNPEKYDADIQAWHKANPKSMRRRPKRVIKACVICGKEFDVPPSQAKKYVSCSLECSRIRRSQLKNRFIDGLSNTPERKRICARRNKLRREYDMTLEGWETLFNSQRRCCANPACQTTEPKDIRGYWHTDHNHFTGKIRGILCRKCNLALGHVNDSTDLLRGLIEYIEKSAT